MFTKYGYFTIGIVLLISIVIFILAYISENNFFRYPLAIAGFLLLIFTLNFFRDPERFSPNKDNVIVSPADGKVILIKEVFDNKYIGQEAIQISIFMSPLDVHINRIPLSGTVEYLNYVEGKYLIASNDKADLENERNEIGISNGKAKVFFTQVAGFMARRIISELQANQQVNIGERFGMIKFGSRADIVVPKNYQLKVKEGQQVYAGETILFEYKNEN